MRSTGAMLVGGFLVFLVGAGFWLVREFERPLEERLRAAFIRRRRWIWIHAWMVAGTLLGSAATISLARLLIDDGAGAEAWAGVGLFTGGCALWLVALAIHLTATPSAAERLARTGAVPAEYLPRHSLAAKLHAVHMVASYVTFALLGVAMLRTTVVPVWVAWTGVSTGMVGAAGFLLLHGGPFSPPIMAHAFGLLVGVVLLTR